MVFLIPFRHIPPVFQIKWESV